MTEELHIVERSFHHPHVQQMDADVQAFYAKIYDGVGDESPTNATHFEGDAGIFLVGYLCENPIAMGGWRIKDLDELLLGARPVAEIKRLYVAPEHRRLGWARVMLTALEDRARDAGVQMLVLETGTRQQPAIAMYQGAGYTPVDGAGWSYYNNQPDAVHLGKRL